MYFFLMNLRRQDIWDKITIAPIISIYIKQKLLVVTTCSAEMIGNLSNIEASYIGKHFFGYILTEMIVSLTAAKTGDEQKTSVWDFIYV